MAAEGRTRLIALVAVSALVLLGCGDDDSAPDGTVDAAPTATADAAEPAVTTAAGDGGKPADASYSDSTATDTAEPPATTRDGDIAGEASSDDSDTDDPASADANDGDTDRVYGPSKVIDVSTGEVVHSDFVIKSNSPLRVIPVDYFPNGDVSSAHWFTLPDSSAYDAGKQLFYFDHTTTDGEPEATVVLVHGNPENSYTYRHLRDTLIESGRPLRIVAMDHIGFGLSDQADFEMVDMHHSANLLALIHHLELSDVTLVVHDWGGPIGIGAFSQEPDRVRNLLVMNTSIFPMPAEGLTYTTHPSPGSSWSAMPDLISDDDWGGLAPAIILNSTAEGLNQSAADFARYFVAFRNQRFEEASEEYVFSEQFRSIDNVRSSKRNVRQTPVWGHGYTYEEPVHGVHDNNAFYDAMQQAVPQHWGPSGRNIAAAGYFGALDPVGKVEVIAQWHAALPRMAELTYTYPDIGHFIEEIKGAEMAHTILAMNSPD